MADNDGLYIADKCHPDDYNYKLHNIFDSSKISANADEADSDWLNYPDCGLLKSRVFHHVV